MGTDIHMAVEVRGRNGWEPVYWPNKYAGTFGDESATTLRAYDDRNYDAFAILANVRNGHRFAGVDTGDGFAFICEGRGFPQDCHPDVRRYVSECGDHSTTYCTLREVLDFDWARESVHRGWINAPTFDAWDRTREWEPRPASYCGGVSGGSIEHVTEDEMRARVTALRSEYEGRPAEFAAALEKLHHVYCQVSWAEGYADAAGSFWTHWVPRLLKLGAPEDVRLVYSFDS